MIVDNGHVYMREEKGLQYNGVEMEGVGWGV